MFAAVVAVRVYYSVTRKFVVVVKIKICVLCVAHKLFDSLDKSSSTLAYFDISRNLQKYTGDCISRERSRESRVCVLSKLLQECNAAVVAVRVK